MLVGFDVGEMKRLGRLERPGPGTRVLAERIVMQREPRTGERCLRHCPRALPANAVDRMRMRAEIAREFMAPPGELELGIADAIRVRNERIAGGTAHVARVERGSGGWAQHRLAIDGEARDRAAEFGCDRHACRGGCEFEDAHRWPGVASGSCGHCTNCANMRPRRRRFRPPIIEEDSMKHAVRNAVMATAVAAALGIVAGATSAADKKSTAVSAHDHGRYLVRSEERRVGKECRSRW